MNLFKQCIEEPKAQIHISRRVPDLNVGDKFYTLFDNEDEVVAIAYNTDRVIIKGKEQMVYVFNYEGHSMKVDHGDMECNKTEAELNKWKGVSVSWVYSDYPQDTLPEGVVMLDLTLTFNKCMTVTFHNCVIAFEDGRDTIKDYIEKLNILDRLNVASRYTTP